MNNLQAVSDCRDIVGSAQVQLVTSGTNAEHTDPLPKGIYDFKPDIDCYVKIHETAADDVTTSTGCFHPANAVIPYFVPDQHRFGVVGGATVTSQLHRVQKFGPGA